MENVHIPQGYQQVMPYLVLPNATAFIDFMKAVFDATEKYKAMRTETLIAHAELIIGNCTIMFADVTDEFRHQPAGLFIYVSDCDTIYQKALRNGSSTVMPPDNQSYGRSAGVKDPFGNTWWITTA